MKIKLLTSMGIDGKHTKAGTVVDVDASFGRYQCSVNRAVEVNPAPKPSRGVVSTAEGTEPLDDKEPEAPKPKKPAK